MTPSERRRGKSPPHSAHPKCAGPRARSVNDDPAAHRGDRLPAGAAQVPGTGGRRDLAGQVDDLPHPAHEITGGQAADAQHTGVPQVCINFGRPDQRALSRVTAEELKRYADEGHFAPGSMLPKIQAVIQFLECPGREGRRAVITDPQSLGRAVEDKAGTHVVP